MAASTTKNVSVKFEITGNGVTVTKKLDGSVSKLNLTMKQANSVAKQYDTTLQGLTGKTFKTSNAEFQKMAGHMGKMSDATGGATSAAMELGRVVSDAPYGIRGMANNITQLVSQLGFAAKATDKVTGKTIGWKGALKGMFSSLVGPLGIVFAITAVVSAIDYFFGAASKAEESTDDLASSFEDLADVISDNANASIREYIRLLGVKAEVDKLSGENSERLEEINEDIDSKKEKRQKLQLRLLGDLTIAEYEALSASEAREVRRKAQDGNFTRSLNDLKKLTPDILALEQERLDVYKEMTDAINKRKKLERDFKNAEEGTLKFLKNRLKDEKKYRELQSDSRSEYLRLTEAILKTEKEIEAIEGKKKKRERSGRVRAFRQQLLDLSKEYRNYIEENEKLTERSARERLRIEGEANMDELDAKYHLYVAKQEQRLTDYLATVKDNKLREEAQVKHAEAMIRAEEQYLNTSVALRQKNQTQLAEFDRIEEERQIQANFKLRENEIKHLKQLYEDRDLLFQERKIQLEEEKLAELERQANVDGLGDQEKFDAELAVSMQRMELRQAELDHETMIIEERKRVNMEYVGFIGQLGGIFQQLAGENEALATAALVIEKGAAIAKVVVATTAANAEIVKASSASAGEQFAKGTALAGAAAGATAMNNYKQAAKLGAASKVNFIGAAATKADAAKRVSANKISAGISIAAILASTIRSGGSASSGGSGGGGGSTGGSREFDFNLVGSTGQNQLAQGIAGQFSQPIQAYVVSTQMSSQQQLDARIQSTASLGE